MRHARTTDLPTIVAIYNAAIPSRQATADTKPVSVESKKAWFEAHAPERYPLLVHEIEGQVVAWAGLQAFHGRPAYKHTAEISFYIAPEQQGKGIGHLLIDATIDAARKTGLKTLIAYVFSHNVPSLTLLDRHGFAAWGKLPNVTEMDGQEYSVSMLGKRIAP